MNLHIAVGKKLCSCVYGLWFSHSFSCFVKGICGLNFIIISYQIDYCKNLKNLRADLKAKKAADLEKEKLDIEHGIEDMEDVESSPADPVVTPAAKTTIGGYRFSAIITSYVFT